MKRLAAALAVLVLVAAGCRGTEGRAQGSENVLRLGIFPNLTHAPGLVALASGILEETLAPTTVDLRVFNSGKEAQTAILAGSLDATYIGPGPTATLYLKSKKIAVISGAVANGASFVVRTGSGITKPADLHGKKIAVPGIGNTQDIALRTWLAEHGLKPREEGGDVGILAVDNPQLPQAFRSGDIDAAWEPEPWPSLLVDQGLATEFLNETELWPNGEFVTTNLIASTTYMDAHPEVIAKLVEANVKAIQLMEDDPDEAKRLANEQLAEVGAATLPANVLDTAWDALHFTWEPLADSLTQTAENAHALGILEEDPAGLEGLYRLADLHDVLNQLGLEEVDA
jgi:NitT/TauT family transport system substrate-binding protein